MTVEWRDGFFHAWNPSPEDVKAATKSMVAHIDSIILGSVYAHLRKQEENEVQDSTDGEGKSWHDRPPLL